MAALGYDGNTIISYQVPIHSDNQSEAELINIQLSPKGYRVIDKSLSIRNKVDLDNIKAIGGESFIIKGNLAISGDDIVNLNGLESLTEIDGGNLIIGTSNTLNDINGLQNLKTIRKAANFGGSLLIHGNTSLKDLRGLESLNTIDSQLKILDNPSLISLDGLDQLQSVNEDVEISSNGSLKNLDGLNNLKTVGKGIKIENNAALESIAGLGGLQSIDGDIEISTNDLLPIEVVEAWLKKMTTLGYEGNTIISYQVPIHFDNQLEAELVNVQLSSRGYRIINGTFSVSQRADIDSIKVIGGETFIIKGNLVILASPRVILDTR